jgi:hypothetical protein
LTFRVSQLNDLKLEWWSTDDEVPNLRRQDGKTWGKTKFDSMTLRNAFGVWLSTERGKLGIKGGITYLDIIELYLYKISKKAPAGLTEAEKAKWKANMQRSISKAREEGDRLFLQFLDEQLDLNDKIRLEQTWNGTFNNYLQPDYEKIPVAFNVAKEFFGEDPFIVKPEKREAVSFILNEGSGCLAYDVGVGKTMAAIMIAEQFMVAGYCKRPFIVVPNQTYTQWVSEIKNVLPHREVIGMYNLGKGYADEWAEIETDEDGYLVSVSKQVPENSITVMTYQGFEAIGFNKQTRKSTLDRLFEILNQGTEEDDKKAEATLMQKLEKLVGRSQKKAKLNIEELGFDFMCVDEAHSMKKVFTTVKAEEVETETGGTKNKSFYHVHQGSPSNIGLKGFVIAQYILNNNRNRNVLLLTATPFTNSPLEVFSMLSLVGYNKLTQMGVNNINEFFSEYIGVSDELTINHKYQPVYKQVVKGFSNLPSLHKLVTRFFNYKTGEDVGVVRPNKIVIPYKKTLIDNVITKLPSSEQIDATIEPSEVQREYMNNIIAFAESKSMSYTELMALSGGVGDELEEDTDDESSVKSTEETTLDFNDLDSDALDKARAIISMNLSRATALSPYLYKFHALGKPTYKDFVELSPKIHYTMLCIESVKKYHEQNGQAVSGQVIYSNLGIEYFPLMKEYLVKEIGFKPHEVGFIKSKGMSLEKRKAAQDQFLGRKFDTKKNDFVKISDEKRMKVLIGSSSIKEGMNLQKKSTVLYNLYIDWNPTDNLQLQGRIWRQGNMYRNVRIVNPLLVDSSDVFMFQKLEEKTARINTIWANDGRSALRLDEFDPEELKKSLIKNPYVLAGILILERKAKLVDDIKYKESFIERLKDFTTNKRRVDELMSKLPYTYELWNQTPTENLETMFNKLKKLQVINEPKDKDGKIFARDFERQYGKLKNLSDKELAKYRFDRPDKPNWFDELNTKLRLVKKDEKEILNPRGWVFDAELGITQYIEELNKELEQLKETQTYYNSDNYRDKLVEEILEEREKKKLKIQNVYEASQDFERMNYLLNFQYCDLKPKKAVKTVSLVDKINGAISDLNDLIGVVSSAVEKKVLQAIDDLNDLKAQYQ